jgi:hypothetical protein
MTTKEYVSIDNNEHIADDFTEDNLINDESSIDLLINNKINKLR